MTINSRTKGADGEREFLALCRRRLGMRDLRRNLRQYQDGGADVETCLGGFCVEIKRAKRWQNVFWEQAEAQAVAVGASPALAWRADRNPWLVFVRASELRVEVPSGRIALVVEDWLALVRRRMVEECL